MPPIHPNGSVGPRPDWSKVRAIIMDADGTLTDGGIFIDDRGTEFKRFDVRDGLGISLWHRAGGRTGVITGRKGLALTHRMRELGIGVWEQGISNKVGAFDRIISRLGVARSECVFLGDDLPDLAVMRVAGVPVAVADSPAEIKSVAQHVTAARGGHGAVRELIETVLRAQAKWDLLVAQYSQSEATSIQ